MKHSYLVVGLAVLGIAGMLGAAPGPENFTARIGSGAVCAKNESTVGKQVDIDVLLDFAVGDVQGFSFGICTGDESVAVPTDTAVSNDVLTAKVGYDPPKSDFIKLNILEGGVTMGVVVDFFAEAKIPATTGFKAATITYDVVYDAALQADCTPQATCALTLCDTLGSPAVASVAVVGGASIPFGGPNENGEITVAAQEVIIVEPTFVRGDANQDERVDIADGIWILNELFFASQYPDNVSACKDAADANDDGGVDASDAMYIFMWQFSDGAEPPAPFGACGVDPTADDLPECVYELCP